MTQTCSSCSIEIPEGQAVALRPAAKDQQPDLLCPGCTHKLESALKAETHNPNYLGGSLMGLAAGLVTTLIWFAIVAFMHVQIGLVAIVVGFVVGQAVVIGAGGKRGGMLQLTSVAITVLSLGLAEYEIVRHGLSAQGMALPLIPTPTLMLEVDWISLSSDPLTILFWAIAAFQAFTIPAVRRLNKM